MSERHKRKNARALLSKSGYKAGGHFNTEKMIGEAVHEHEGALHPNKPKTPMKFKDGGTVTGMPGPRTHKPRGGKKGKSHTTVNVVVGAHKPSPPMAVPVPVGGPPPVGPMAGPPPIGPGAGMPPGGLPGQMPGANRGGRFAKGGAVKIDSQRDPIQADPKHDVVGKLAKGGRAKTKHIIDDGAGGGLGRLEKAKAYGARV